MTKAHVHAENMRLYAEDAAKMEAPYELWEFKYCADGDDTWQAMSLHPNWSESFSFRRKPRMITVGKHSWPEPMKEAPTHGYEYFFVDLAGANLAYKAFWSGGDVDENLLSKGQVHTTEEAAKSHAQAMIAISKGDT